MDWFDTIAYLETGSSVQQQAYRLLTSYRVMDMLQQYNPILAGTIPINIDIEGSDLDILCCCDDTESFVTEIVSAFSRYPDFTINRKNIDDNPTVIANFLLENFEVEIFGQPVPVKKQNGYRHMIAEYSILLRKGEDFRQEIIRIKQSGLKTEPAFAKLLSLEGDPYKTLLDYCC